MSSKNHRSRYTRAANVASAFGARQTPAALRAAQAAAELRRGEAELRRTMGQFANAVAAQRAGRAAEVHHTATFNADAAMKGVVERARTTASSGQPCAPADVLITRGRTVRSAQVKYHGSPESNATHLGRTAYRTMQKVVPSDQAARVREVAGRRANALAAKRPARATEMRDTASRASDRIRGESAESRPLSSGESRKLANDPGRLGRSALKTELVGAVKSGAAVGAGVSAFVSGVVNIKAVLDDEKTAGEAAKAVAIDTAKGAAVGAGTALAATLVKQGLMRVGMQSAARGAAPVAIVCTAVEAGAGVVAYARGEIDGRECAVRTAKAAGRTASGFAGAKLGALIGAPLGPVGALVGGLLGGLAGALAFGAVADRRATTEPAPSPPREATPLLLTEPRKALSAG